MLNNKKKNGYYKFYNKDGKWCKIKITKRICKRTKIIVMFKPENEDNFLSLIPNRYFKSEISVVNYIVKNLTTNGTKFKIVPLD